MNLQVTVTVQVTDDDIDQGIDGITAAAERWLDQQVRPDSPREFASAVVDTFAHELGIENEVHYQ